MNLLHTPFAKLLFFIQSFFSFKFIKKIIIFLRDSCCSPMFFYHFGHVARVTWKWFANISLFLSQSLFCYFCFRFHVLLCPQALSQFNKNCRMKPLSPTIFGSLFHNDPSFKRSFLRLSHLFVWDAFPPHVFAISHKSFLFNLGSILLYWAWSLHCSKGRRIDVWQFWSTSSYPVS